MAQKQQKIDIVFKDIVFRVKDKLTGEMKTILNGVSG
jgi:hypothetical protein